MRDSLYKFGVIFTILGLAGIADAITEQGSIMIAVLTFSVGFGMVIGGYRK